MRGVDPELPCPAFTINLALRPLQTAAELDALPAAAGVLAFEDHAGATLHLTIAANMRLAARQVLGVEPAAGSVGRVVFDVSIVARVLALPVGGAFEADWAWLQLARKRLPSTYRSMADQWQVWFISCNPASQFPQWTKTTLTPASGAPSPTVIGPFFDKHAAAGFIEVLQDAFDLCRYHHILMQAPRGVACAYKEMGRCPAPCDGSISLDAYRAAIERSVEFASGPASFRAHVEAAMRDAAATLEFERAGSLRELFKRTAPGVKGAFAQLARLEQFVFLAVQPSLRARWARLMLVRGGFIEPFADLRIDADRQTLESICEAVLNIARPIDADFSPPALENIGLAARHMFRARRRESRASFLAISDLKPAALGKAIARLKSAGSNVAAIDSSPLAHQQPKNGNPNQNG